MMWDTDWISVVERMISSGLRRPLDSMRCEAKMVLIRVDLPSPVWPVVRRETRQLRSRAGGGGGGRRSRAALLTDTDDIELESTLEELALDLGRDAIETDVALGVNRGSGHRRHCVGGKDDGRGTTEFQNTMGVTRWRVGRIDGRDSRQRSVTGDGRWRQRGTVVGDGLGTNFFAPSRLRQLAGVPNNNFRPRGLELAGERGTPLASRDWRGTVRASGTARLGLDAAANEKQPGWGWDVPALQVLNLSGSIPIRASRFSGRMLNFAILHRDDDDNDIGDETLERDNDRGTLLSGASRHRSLEHENQTRFLYSGTT